MIEENQPTPSPYEMLRQVLGKRVLDLEQAVDLFGSQITGSQFWVILFDQSGAAVVEDAVRRYYSTDKPDDCVAVLSQCAGGQEFFGMAALSKRAMLGYQLTSILRRAGAGMTEREMNRSNVLVLADRARLSLLADFSREVFGDSSVVVGASDVSAKKIFEGGGK